MSGSIPIPTSSAKSSNKDDYFQGMSSSPNRDLHSKSYISTANKEVSHGGNGGVNMGASSGNKNLASLSFQSYESSHSFDALFAAAHTGQRVASNPGVGLATIPSSNHQVSYMPSAANTLANFPSLTTRDLSNVGAPFRSARTASFSTHSPIETPEASRKHFYLTHSMDTIPHHGIMNVYSIVKNRTGSVLSRKTILKSDHFDLAMRTDVDFFLQGAPNFRGVEMNIYGVAQPTVSGISTILSLLKCHKEMHGLNKNCVVWFSAREEPMIYINRRPFVIRDEDSPLQNVKRYQGISSLRLQQMEDRLKQDILTEVKKCQGLLLVHDELDTGDLIPTWTAVDIVQTQFDVFDEFQERGYQVKYHRIPISPEQAPDDKYIDEYLTVIKNTPFEASLVFNCGMGLGRTTFAMVLALLTRKSQCDYVSLNNDDFIFPQVSGNGDSQIDLLATEADSKNRALLRLVYILEKGLSSHGVPHYAIDWALARSPIIDDLKNAVLGNYQCVLQLTSVLQDGSDAKRKLDDVINKCDKFINIREEILRYRIAYSVTGNQFIIEKAWGCLERYIFLLSFSSYVAENGNLVQTFHNWLSERPEIWKMLEYLRKKGPRLQLFRPVEDLSAFSGNFNLPGTSGQAARATELEKFVIKSRKGTVLVHHTILKIDDWSKGLEKHNGIAGAANFRKIPAFDVYGVAQPTIEGINNVLENLLDKTVIWINLREEPLVYVNGSPYVLRDKYFTLRNIKSYSGITPNRLEYLEERLKEDVVNELDGYDGRILLHGENSSGGVVHVWEDVESEHVQTMHEIMSSISKQGSPLEYHRVPVTAETPMDEADFDHLLKLVSRKSGPNTAIVLNCQMGQGRSTTGTVVACLVIQWLEGQQPPVTSPATTEPARHYQIIHSLMRVIKNGLECKLIVDHIIDQCASIMNLRQSIEECRLQAEQSVDDEVKYKKAVKKGLLHLKRYFLLIVFKGYLNDTNPESLEETESFKSWLQRHPELVSMIDELEEDDIKHLIPVEQLRPGDGIALTSEVLDVVSSRHGSVLAAQTILKYDMFPGCQKLSLPDKVEGAPNYRRVTLEIVRNYARRRPADVRIESNSKLSLSQSQEHSAFVYGIAMPTTAAIRNVLKKVDSGPEGKRRLLWTSLREEPVLYVNGRPFVLRLFQDPVKNLEATGIARERVENMELQMKKDAIAELKKYNGRLLLHEEFVDGNSFSILPVWETVDESQIQTPLEVYNNIVADGYNIDYLRIPITDEQAPIPNVFDQLVERLCMVGSPHKIDAMFNCQMGRGRTTTGMVITCLMQMIIGNSQIKEMSLDDLNESVNSLSLETSGTEEDEIVRYKNGEFKIILQLLSVLQYGKLSKKLTDKAIDLCEHLQNLRVAIYDYKLRIEALETGTKKHESMLNIGLNYLIRYFYLITFADYLVEVMSSIPLEETNYRKWPKFSVWLKERQEILNLVHPSNQSLQ